MRNRIVRAFTLVEMLVVIAIICVLAGLLMPALQKALYSSYALSCQNNMRTVSFGWQNWVSDHNGTLPPATAGASVSPWNRRGITGPLCNEYDPSCPFTDGITWVVMLQPYLNLGKFGRTNVAASVYWSLAAGDRSGIFSCPSASVKPTYLTAVQYGLNQWNIAGRSAYGVVAISKITDMYSPSKKVTMMDTHNGGSGGEPGSDSFYGGETASDGRVDFDRHQTGAANCVYADGHIGQWNHDEYIIFNTVVPGYKTEQFGYGNQKGSPY